MNVQRTSDGAGLPETREGAPQENPRSRSTGGVLLAFKFRGTLSLADDATDLLCEVLWHDRIELPQAGLLPVRENK